MPETQRIPALRELLQRHPAPWDSICSMSNGEPLCIVDGEGEEVFDIQNGAYVKDDMKRTLQQILVALVNAAAEDVG